MEEGTRGGRSGSVLSAAVLTRVRAEQFSPSSQNSHTWTPGHEYRTVCATGPHKRLFLISAVVNHTWNHTDILGWGCYDILSLNCMTVKTKQKVEGHFFFNNLNLKVLLSCNVCLKLTSTKFIKFHWCQYLGYCISSIPGFQYLESGNFLISRLNLCWDDFSTHICSNSRIFFITLNSNLK